MKKMSIYTYRLPERKEPGPPVKDLLPHASLMALSSIATDKVVKMTLRAVSRAEVFEARHPLWNSFADSYIRMVERFEEINSQFPGVTRVIHNSEIVIGDILVSDFQLGLNFGCLDSNMAPQKIRVLAIDGDTVKGAVLQGKGADTNEVYYFKNELWFFLSHKFAVYSNRSGKKL